MSETLGIVECCPELFMQLDAAERDVVLEERSVAVIENLSMAASSSSQASSLPSDFLRR